jgi:ribulose-phosphate 3-epimerase
LTGSSSRTDSPPIDTADATPWFFHALDRYLRTTGDRALLEELLNDLDLVLIMSVNPGYAGQSYLPQATDKIRRVRELLDRHRVPATLEVDGGITVETIEAPWSAGADTFVAGTAVFGADDPARAVRDLLRQCAVRV